MKVIIILLIATFVTLGNLEPTGYKQLDSTTGQSDRYLPSSLSSQLPSDRSISKQGLTPESHYLPTSYQSPSQNVVPNSLYLPTTNIRSSSSSSLSSLFGILNSSGSSSSVVGGIPSVQYLPSQSSISRQNPFNSGNGPQYSSQNPGTITTTTTTTTTTSGITSNLDRRISNSLGVTNTHIRPQTTTSQLHMSNRNSAAGAVSSSQYLPPPSPPPPSSPSLPSLSSSIPSTSLVSTSKHSDLFIQSLPVPSSNYLATAVSKQNRYHKRIDQPSSISASASSSSSSLATSSGIISNTYLTPNKLSSSLSGFSSLSHNNHYTGDATTTTTTTGTSTSIAGQPRQSNILVGGNINQPPGNYYPSSPSGYSDETFAGYDNHQPLAKYEFEYHVNDEYGNDYSHKESKNDNKITQGVYTVLLPDGRKQIVHYTADQDGFKPTITYEESPVTGYQY